MMSGVDPAGGQQGQDALGKTIGLFICHAPQFIGYVTTLENQPS